MPKRKPNPMDALAEAINDRELAAAMQYLYLFKTRPDLDPKMTDLNKAVAIVAAHKLSPDWSRRERD